MPLKVTSVATAGEVHPNPFVGPIDYTLAILIDISTMTDKEVDAYGYLKPGVPVTASGDLLSTNTEVVYGCTAEAVKVAESNTTTAIAAATDIEIALVLIGVVNRDILEDSLGRALTADEIAGFAVGKSHLILTPT